MVHIPPGSRPPAPPRTPEEWRRHNHRVQAEYQARRMKHKGACARDAAARDVCEGMYLDKCGQVFDLCETLRAVYALCGEDPKLAAIINLALARHES